MQLQTKHKLIQSAGLVGGLTFLSRILGMLRDVASASLFGTTKIWDAFVLAFTIPNLLRRLVFEGALAGAFIPIFVEIERTRGKEEAERFASQVGTSLFIFVLALAGVFYLGAFSLKSFGIFTGKSAMALDFFLLLFPYLFLLLAVALGMGILASAKHFFTPALSQIVLNLAWLLAVWMICPWISSDRFYQVRVLCGVIVISGAVQLLLQWFPLRARGYQLKLIWDFSSPHLRRFMSLLLPAVLGFSVFNLNILVDLVFGYFLPEGSSSSLWYASRLMQFPLGIFAVSLGTVLVPEYSHQAADKNDSLTGSTLSFSLRSVFLIILPAAVGLILLAHPIVEMLFERGEFTALSTARTQSVLIAYSLGLVAYAGLQIMVSVFYGLGDIKTPVRAGMFSLALHLILNFILLQLMGVTGLALSTALSGIVNFSILVFGFYKKMGDFEIRRLSVFFGKILGVSLFMGWAVVTVYARCPVFPLMTSIGVGIAIYIAGCLLVRVHEMRRMFEWIFVKK